MFIILFQIHSSNPTNKICKTQEQQKSGVNYRTSVGDIRGYRLPDSPGSEQYSGQNTGRLFIL